TVITASMAAVLGYAITLFLPPLWSIGGVALLLLLLTAFWLWKNGKLNPRTAMVLLVAAGFILRLLYVLYTPVSVRQHDVWYFSYGPFEGLENHRHAEYIEYIATNLKLPMTDPTAVGLSQIYHPPFHHLIAGLWLRLQWMIGIDKAASYENIQLLTLFYSSALMILTARIANCLQVKGWAKTLMVSIVCFHPTLILMAGSVNNDILSFTLAIYGVFTALRWYQNPKIKTIIPVAFGVGLSMMTKLSGGLVAVAIALLFLWKWFTELKHHSPLGKAIFWQFALFAVICVPIALWWPFKNSLLYDMPLTYVPALSANSDQYIGDYTFLQRLFGIEPGALNQLFVAWQTHDTPTAYNEYNLILALLKTSMFGEFTLFTPEMGLAYPLAMTFAYGLFFANVGLILLSLYALVRWLIRNYNTPTPWVFALLIAVPLFSYVQFCFGFPQTCTQNFRYVLPALLGGAAALGVHLKHSSKPFRLTMTIFTLAFCACSVAVYTMLGMV
ncbi:MAG: hypothetical protein IKU10_07500, partial [Clostridia bacterium]|nr:hypothetical protein [Clostridia bacterium]